MGIEVTAIPTWRADPAWRSRLDAIGVETRLLRPREVQFPAGSIVLGMCNPQFITLAPRLKRQGCRLVYLPCMTFVQHAELSFLCDGGQIDAWVFQSEFQCGRWQSTLEQFGQAERARLIRGAFDVSEFPFRRRPAPKPGEPFVVGRLSRPDPAKYPADLWQILEAVPNVHARVMGWSAAVERHVGRPPPSLSVEILRTNAEPARTFLDSLDVLLQVGGTAEENWPRVGLEAMATGVPIIAEDRGGWPEMIRSGQDGILVSSTASAIEALKYLHACQDRRFSLALNAGASCFILCHPDPISVAWGNLFAILQESEQPA
jgi:glycosyltransferase involved in cell wall biosynthesis